MVRSSYCGARRRRSLPLVLCLLIVAAPGIGIAGDKASSRMADDPVLLCVVPPAPGNPPTAGFSCKAGGLEDVDLDQRYRTGNSPLDVAPDKSKLFMVLLMLRSTNGRYPFLVLH